MGDYVYNFWQDKAHPARHLAADDHGVVPRQGHGVGTVIDIDALSKAGQRDVGLQGVELSRARYKRAWWSCRAAAATPSWCASSTPRRRRSYPNGSSSPKRRFR
jgi:prolyl oligopeptidase PreP (S9A serine peptidase family)